MLCLPRTCVWVFMGLVFLSLHMSSLLAFVSLKALTKLTHYDPRRSKRLLLVYCHILGSQLLLHFLNRSSRSSFSMWIVCYSSSSITLHLHPSPCISCFRASIGSCSKRNTHETCCERSSVHNIPGCERIRVAALESRFVWGPRLETDQCL